MSLKKRMFRSNMLILCSALVSLMLILLLVLILFEDSVESQLHSISQTRLESHVGEVARIVDQEEMDRAQDLQKEVGKWGYQSAVIQEGKVRSGDDSDRMADLAEFFHQEQISGNETNIFSFEKMTIVGKELSGGRGYLVAVHFPEENWLTSSLNSSFYLFLGGVFLAGISAIVILLILASFFTRKMNRRVMEPVELLVSGAERIKNGNLQEEIVYEGEEEFEHVCQTFNAMQHTILEDQKQREKYERARTDMVTGISHDLRTPLTSIRGYIKGVLDHVADTPKKQELYLRTAYESTEEMNVLLQKLFDFSRMESGQMPFHMVRVDLAEFTAAYTAKKEEALEPGKGRMTFRKDQETLPEILMDVEQIPQIFDNLLENSMKYAGTCPVEIEIHVFESEDSVVLEWKDNGSGVPEEKLPRIFERFYRCDESRSEQGSGVGLYVASYIMERHQGRIEAENDQGLKIRLIFPKEV